MPQQRPHIERHFTASDSVRDIVIGMSDGLTVPFALAAGLSGAIFGYIKGRFTGKDPLCSALQTVPIGWVAAGAAFLIARAISAPPGP